MVEKVEFLFFKTEPFTYILLRKLYLKTAVEVKHPSFSIDFKRSQLN